jgi:signal transduction histidine kinase
MKTHSIERRIVTAVITVQLVMALCVTVFGFLYERHAQFRSLNIALEGRAQSLFGAVEDADDEDDNVLLDPNALHSPQEDLFVVRESTGRILGASTNLKDPASILGDGAEGHFTTTIDGQEYRVVRMRAVRTIDPEAHGNGTRHTLTIAYATRAARTWHAVYGALRFFAITNLALLVLTALLVSSLVRRSMRPLVELTSEAGRISAPRWSFTPPESVRKTKELAPLVAAIDGVVQRLEMSFAQQRQFLGDAAHELKTAVAVIKSSLQLMNMRPRTITEYSEGVLRAEMDCVRMEELVGRMLALARIEEGHSEAIGHAVATDTDLVAGAAAAIAQLRPIAEILQVRVESRGPVALTGTIAPELWHTLCTNVLLNAIQYSAPGSAVTVHLEETADGMAQCVIRDHGIGISPENLPNVFHRFYRGDPSRSRASGGTGLGLSICKAIAERAGGTISIDSSPGLGTAITILLPMAVKTVTTEPVTV